MKDEYEVVGVVADHREMARRPDDIRSGIRARMFREDSDGPLLASVAPPAVYGLGAH